MAPTPIPHRLHHARLTLADFALDAYIVLSSDPHLSEYLPAHWQGREWLSGFTGSAGTLVFTATDAALFTDSRYWTQAQTELNGSGIELVKQGAAGAPTPIQWLTARLQKGQTVGADGAVMGLAFAQTLREALTKIGANLRTDTDLFATIWTDRPPPPSNPITEHALEYASQASAEKLAQVRQLMRDMGATHHFLSSLDDIAWLFNLRGSDIPYNPVFLSHALITLEKETLFHSTHYPDAATALSTLPTDTVLLIDPKRIPLGMRECVPAGVKIIERTNPSILLKCRKDEKQAAHIRRTMERDGAAMCRFYAWLEAALARGERVTEITVDERLSAERARQPDFVSLSFGTIAAFKANGAMAHYSATESRHAVIEGDGLLLIDSGGQYLGGTTDITRVWPIGTVSTAQQRDYTLVLKGLINLSRAHFPLGTPAPMLDALARAPLWEHGLDYGHGTGHGVGYFLNVHEGPQSISKAMPTAEMAMQAGMVTSIEPALYRDGQWGIRLENLVLNVPRHEGNFLAFETLTLCPIDTRCIEASLLRTDEIDWLNNYHATVRERLAPLLEGAALDWLMVRTTQIHS